MPLPNARTLVGATEKHERRVRAIRIEKRSVLNRVLPPAVPVAAPGVGHAFEDVGVGLPDREALDHHVQAIAARREDDMLILRRLTAFCSSLPVQKCSA